MDRRKLPLRLGAALGAALMLVSVLADPYEIELLSAKTAGSVFFYLLGYGASGALIGAMCSPALWLLGFGPRLSGPASRSEQ